MDLGSESYISNFSVTTLVILVTIFGLLCYLQMVDSGSDNLIKIKKKKTQKLGSSASFLGLAFAIVGNLNKHMGSSDP